MHSLAAAAVVFTAAACVPKGPADPEVEAAKALAERVVGPKQARHFVFEKAEGEGDFFRLEQRGGKLAVIGNDANSMAVGYGTGINKNDEKKSAPFLGLTAQLGLEYTFWFPLQVSVDFRPGFMIPAYMNRDNWYGFALAARYAF